ncbi:ricin-type beta-trefoil lectin domain protein [Streptomyces cacaoi]|uniref:ricin-type beta-trefoil lectin domain protein n=1 Tax=Streptomyces cacaoi TaxID=1898 RepID=UPI0011F224D7|nr:ricin-type beta-trefoil lectin domain protein [Streptomyces cacaoi]
MARARPVAAVAAALTLMFSGAGVAAAAPGAPPGQDGTGGARASKPLPPELEKIRAAEAEKLYGSAAERPMDERKTSLISLGDSEISGEGVGTYEPGTNGPDNWCHRSPDSAIHRTGILADVTYNVSCSGASSENIRIGGTKQFADELVQSDSLAIKARNTRLKQIVLVAGANDDLQFGPVMTDCVTRYLTLQGPCEPKYTPVWQDRVDGLVPKIEQTVGDLKSVMRDAGYADDDYQLLVVGYPSPIGPDFHDNPDFPGKLIGGCLGHTSDTRWGRDTAVPAFEKGMRKAAEASGADYLDASRLFHGHEVCMENTWTRGLYVDLTNPVPPDENSVRQSFHPNKRGHGAFADCFTKMWQAGKDGVREASCADPDGSGRPQLYRQAWDDVFQPLRNEATGTCLDADGSHSAVGTQVRGWSCKSGQRNQQWWYDTEGQRLYTALTHDRCVRSAGTDGAGLELANCSGADDQKFVRDGATLRPATAKNLCVTLHGLEEQAQLAPCDDSAAQRFA